MWGLHPCETATRSASPLSWGLREETDFLVFATIICLLVPDLVRLDHIIISLTDNHQSFVDENSYQPAAESSFVFESRWILRGCGPAVLDHIIRSLRTAEHTASEEVEHVTAS